MFKGTDSDGNYSIEGKAQLKEHGFYLAVKQNVIYQQYDEGDTATLRFDKVELSPDQTSCSIKGLWIQDSDEYTFEGDLKRT